MGEGRNAAIASMPPTRKNKAARLGNALFCLRKKDGWEGWGNRQRGVRERRIEPQRFGAKTLSGWQARVRALATMA